VEKYSPVGDSWSTVAPLPQERYDHVTVAVGSDMYVLGGRNEDDDIGACCLKFDSTQGTWTEVAFAPRAIIESAAVAVDTDIYVF
jgi:N-acetylneuraminic acid mutarotase